MESIKLMKTKAGKGFKLVVGNKWVYTSLGEMYNMLNDKSNACGFREISNKEAD